VPRRKWNTIEDIHLQRWKLLNKEKHSSQNILLTSILISTRLKKKEIGDMLLEESIINFEIDIVMM
jgi:hypothetical protein